MPRSADHDERRRAFAASFQRVLAAEGLPNTSLARVAADAGTSVGLLQYYFSKREDLLRYSYEDCLVRIGQRVDELVSRGEADEQPISVLLRNALREFIPLDAEREAEFRVAQNLWTQALTDPALRQVADGAVRERRARVATAVANGKECGEVPPGVDGDAAASLILAVTDGLAGAVSLAPPRSARVKLSRQVDAALQSALDTVFTGRCRHYESSTRQR